MKHTLGVVVLFTVLTSILAYPLSLAPGELALDLGADTRLFLWSLSWDVHALFHEPLGVFDANIFFPAPRALAYSEHQIGSALLAAPVLVASGDPLLSMNVVLLLSCMLSGAGAYFLARELGASPTAALLSGIVFAFAPPRFFRLGQLHLATVQWMPFCLGYLHRWAAGNGRRRHLLLAAGFFTLQALSGGHGGLFLGLAALGLLVYLWLLGAWHPLRRARRDLVLVALLAAAVNAPFLLPYLRVQEEAGLRRPLSEAEEWSPNAVSFLAAPTHLQSGLLSLVPGAARAVHSRARAFLFPGFLALGLAALAFRRSRREPPGDVGSGGARAAAAAPWLPWLDGTWLLVGAIALVIQVNDGIRWDVFGLTLSARSSHRAWVLFVGIGAVRWAVARTTPLAFAPARKRIADGLRRFFSARMGLAAGFFLVLFVVSLWASLGPRFGLYTVLYRLVPGFDFIRVPSRLTLLSLMALAVLAGIGLDRLLQSVSARWRRTAAAAVLAGAVVEYAAFPLDARPYAIAIPDADRWLSGQPGNFGVVELPVPDPRDAVASARLHSLYMLHSTVHWKGLVNGYSGYTPPGHDALYRQLVNFPDESTLKTLEEWGVRYAVLHRDLYRDSEWDRVERKLSSFDARLERVAGDERAVVYRIIGAPSP